MSKNTALTAYTPTTPQSAYQMAETLARSGLMPSHIKTPEQAFALMACGAELGLGPLESLRCIYFVKGKLAMSAELMLRLVIAHGVRIEWVETTHEIARLKMTRDDWPPFTSSFSMADAKRAQLSGDNWRKYPAAMLRARATSAGIRAYCPDLLTGVYHEGELGEEVPPDHEMQDVTPEPEPEPPKRWTPEEQRRFFAWLKDVSDEHGGKGIAYEDLKAWLSAHNRPKPSEMTEERRGKLLDYLATEDGRETYETWVGRQMSDEPIDAEVVE